MFETLQGKEAELTETKGSSVRGTVTWHVAGQSTARTPFELQIDLETTERNVEENP